MINQPAVVRQLVLVLGLLIGDGFLPPDTNAQAAPILPLAVSARPKSLVWIPISEMVGMVLTLALVISLWVWLRVRQGAANVPADEPILDTAIEDEAFPPAIIGHCPACKKRLKVGGDLAGKKLKCSHCGQPIRIPEKKCSHHVPRDEASSRGT
jgi:hypothetical protein